MIPNGGSAQSVLTPEGFPVTIKEPPATAVLTGRCNVTVDLPDERKAGDVI